MNIKPVIHSTFIIRSQAEYSIATQTIVLRCLLEDLSTGQHRVFTDLDDLLAALLAELTALQHQIIPPNQSNPKSYEETMTWP